MKKAITCIAILTIMSAMVSCGNDNSSSSSKPKISSKTAVSEKAPESNTLAKKNNDPDNGSVQTQNVQSSNDNTENQSNDSIDADINDITGLWIEEIEVAPKTLIINSDYSYELIYSGDSSEYGTIRIENMPASDGSPVGWYNFYDQNGNLWTGFPTSSTESPRYHLYSGYDSEYAFIRDNGNAMGGTDNYSVPNDYGFYEYNEPAREGTAPIMANDIEGEWLHGQYSLVVTGCDMYSGSFEDHNESGDYLGVVRLEYTLDDSNNMQLWYNLYTNDGGLFKSFRATGDIPLNEIYDELDGGFPHTRIIRED